MKSAIKLLVAIDLIFIVLRSLSATFGGIVGDLFYLLSFALPFLLGWFGAKRMRYTREEERGLAEADYPAFSLSRDGVRCFLPLAMPTVAVVYLFALLTSLLLNAIGASAPTVADRPLWQMLLIHALAPAILEEMLFRYLPMKLLYPYSPRATVILSSLFFSLIHLDLYKMPYAFIAGVVLMLADLMTGSVLPSVIIHFVNNLTSVLLMKYGMDKTFLAIYYSVYGVLLAVSLVFVILRFREYRKRAGEALSGKIEYEPSALMLTVLCASVAAMNLLLQL